MGKLELTSSPVDTLGEIPVRDILHTGPGAFDPAMMPDRVVRRISNPLTITPYATFKHDVFALSDLTSTRSCTRQRWQRRHRLARF